MHASFFDNKELSMTAIEKIEGLESEDSFYRILVGGNKEHYAMLENISSLYWYYGGMYSEDELEYKTKEYYNEQFDMFTHNDPFAKGYKGVSFYSTIYNTHGEGYLNHFKGSWLIYQAKGRFESYNLLSTKYWYSNYYTMQPPYGYELIDSEDGIYIYQNKYFIDLGFAYKDTVNAEEVSRKDVLTQDQIFMDYLVTEESNNK